MHIVISQRLDRGPSPVAGDQDKYGGARQADDVHEELEDLEDLVGDGLSCLLKTVKRYIWEDGDAAELSEENEDEESYSSVVHRLPRSLDFGEELDNEDRGGGGAEEGAGEYLGL